MTQFESRLGIFSIKRGFDREFIGLVFSDDLLELVVDFLEADGHRLLGGVVH
jgi:hypothetical protein